MALLTMDEFEGTGLSESDLRHALQEEARKLLGAATRREPPGSCLPLRDPVLLIQDKKIVSVNGGCG